MALSLKQPPLETDLMAVGSGSFTVAVLCCVIDYGTRGKWDALEGGIRVPFVMAGPKILGLPLKKV